MKYLWFAFLTVISGFAGKSFADALRSEGVPFRPNAPVVWAVTNTLPADVTLYETGPQNFSSATISNAMKIGAFSSLNMVPSLDKSVLCFQDKKDSIYMTRFLKIISAQGIMHYYDRAAEGVPIREVPSFEKSEVLALKYLQSFGISTNEVIPKPWPRTQTETTRYDKKGGTEIGKDVSMRGIFLFRAIEGVRVTGNYLIVDFCNNGKPSSFELCWPGLRSVGHCKVPTPDEIVARIQEGHAAMSASNAMDRSVKKWVVTKVHLQYLGSLEGAHQKTLQPALELDLAPNSATENQILSIECPLIEAKHATTE